MARGPPPPVSFDARSHWEACPTIQFVRNQGSCGSCWAVAAASVLADRFCIAASRHNASGERPTTFKNLYLAPQYMLDCSADSEHEEADAKGSRAGCYGGHLDDAWAFFQQKGLPLESCHPYAHCPAPEEPNCGEDDWEEDERGGPIRKNLVTSQTSGNSIASCSSGCAGEGLGGSFFRAATVYAVSAPGDVEAIQQEILRHGPVEAAFFVFSDFHSYRSGTYFRTPSAYGPLGGHAVRILGWGVDRYETDYWLVANSFGPSWGVNGFFHIRRGTNECGIETMPAAGLPHMEGEQK
eukprot:TRINITY_DN35176_c0_g1_i1.p1 TRINITY_DN35176_c0_g1~~TRINITY_DN35176_c0_g1_i1.p1  ORF type:complete len:345 (-),score=40.79 TRINITY_DN35176_c0_g1_i1:34-921(-)